MFRHEDIIDPMLNASYVTGYNAGEDAKGILTNPHQRFSDYWEAWRMGYSDAVIDRMIPKLPGVLC